jgi:hypothetical protein
MGWVSKFCLRELGAAPAERPFAAGDVSEVVGVLLDDGREVVRKSRADESG